MKVCCNHWKNALASKALMSFAEKAILQNIILKTLESKFLRNIQRVSRNPVNI